MRQEAKKVGKNLDQMIENGDVYENVVKSVCVDIIARNLMTSTNSEPMEQMSQSASDTLYQVLFWYLEEDCSLKKVSLPD